MTLRKDHWQGYPAAMTPDIAVEPDIADAPESVDEVDVVLYDSFAQPESDLQELADLVRNPRAEHVVVYTWNFHPDLVADALDQGVRAGWQVIAEVARRAGHDTGVLAGAMASRQLFDAVPFYAGLTLDEIGGRGVRWPASDAGAAFAPGAWQPPFSTRTL